MVHYESRDDAFARTATRARMSQLQIVNGNFGMCFLHFSGTFGHRLQLLLLQRNQKNFGTLHDRIQVRVKPSISTNLNIKRLKVM